MKATDLMIGDWVLITDTQNYKKKGISVMTEEGVLLSEPLKIYSLYPDTITVGTGQRAVAIVTGDMIEPIPLTPEILEKNGFEKYEKFYSERGTIAVNWYFRTNEHFISVLLSDVDRGYRGEIRYTNRSYGKYFLSFFYKHKINVHELQHALRLCGIDKEIEL